MGKIYRMPYVEVSYNSLITPIFISREKFPKGGCEVLVCGHAVLLPEFITACRAVVHLSFEGPAQTGLQADTQRVVVSVQENA